MNTFGALADYYPLNSKLRAEYDKIEKRDDKGVDRICHLFDVEKHQYFKWMRVMFLILMDSGNKGRNMLDDIIYQFVTDKNRQRLFGFINLLMKTQIKSMPIR